MKILLRRGRLNILIQDEKIIVFDKLQATIYAPYFSPNNHLFNQMRDFLLTSEPTEYHSWVDILELAQVCRVAGHGTQKPRLTDFES